MVCLAACSDRPIGYREIARQVGAPEQFTAKILQRLIKSGLVRSIKGPGGGFRLSDQNPDPRLLDIIVVFEGDDIFTACGFGLKDCSDAKPCPLHNQYARIRALFTSMAAENRLSHLASKITKGEAYLNQLEVNDF